MVGGAVQILLSPFLPGPSELFGTMDSVTTYDRIIPLYEAKKETIEEGFKDFGARYTAHFSHWFPGER